MENRKLKQIFLLFIMIILFISSSCGQNPVPSEKRTNTNVPVTSSQQTEAVYKVTFIELGSVNCIPCKAMQPIMKSIEAKYGKEVKVDFHDVWTEVGRPFGLKYGIEAIPTQIFLDNTGKEYYRHVGFFPQAELEKVLTMQGVKLY